MVFVYLVSFFKEMLKTKDRNKLTAEKIVEILVDCLIGQDKISLKK